MTRFAFGNHLRVWRPVGPIGFFHHGVYVSDERVIQFGGRIGEKHAATVASVTLEAFEQGGIAEVVQHGGRTWWGAERFDSLTPEETVRRAEWLVANHPDGLYDLFGYNCEHAAVFCATGAYESYQVRGWFAARAIVAFPLGLFLAKRHRQGPPLPRSVRRGLLVAYLLLLATNLLYYTQGARFMRNVGRPWLEYERRRREAPDD